MSHSPLPPTVLPDALAALLAHCEPEVERRIEYAVRAPLSSQTNQASLTVARAHCQCLGEDERPDDLTILDIELAGLLAARDMFRSWSERMALESHPRLSPAQFLRAWSDSTGRVIQLLRARRELGGQSNADALLDAVYAELEAELLRAPERDAIEEELP